jgi:hypothetical protein
MEDDIPTDKKRQDLYTRRTSSKTSWIDKADDLLHAASFLEPAVEKAYRSWKKQLGISDALSQGDPTETPVIRDGIVEVYFMLVGYAFENLLKGLLVRRIAREKGGAAFKAKLPKSIQTHNVFCLAEELSIQLQPREAGLLMRLEEIIVWRGRYPAPTEYSDLIPFRMDTNDLAVAKVLGGKIRHALRSEAQA